MLLGVWYLTGGWQIWGVRFARERMAVWRGWEGKVGMGEVERRCRGVYGPLGILLEEL